MIQDFKSTFQIFSLGCIIYLFNRLLFVVLDISSDNFVLSLENTFLLLLGASVLVMTIVNVIFIKNKDIVGMSFLLITSAKVVFLVVIAKTQHILESNALEKWHFFSLFAIFLFLETYLTGCRLNKTKF